jgi:hypothetical protein
MGANLLITVILGVVFVALVLWVAVRLRAPRRCEEEPIAEAPQQPESEPEQPISEAPPQPEPPLAGAPLQPEPPLAEVPTPVPEFDADIVTAAEPELSEPAAPPEPVAPPEPQAEPPAPEAIAVPPEPEPEVAAAAEPKPKRKRKRPARRKKKSGGGPQEAQSLGVPAMVHDAYRNIRTWTTSLTPGRALPAILTDPQVDRGEPTTYRFNLKQRPYSIVKTDLTEDDGGGVGPLVHEKVQLLDDKGTTLLEMSLLTADIGSDETPGEVTVFTEGPWLDDFRELNALSSKDSKRIGSDFRKKFRAKEQVRLKRDFGV